MHTMKLSVVVQIPRGVRWIAQNSDGTWTGFTKKPIAVDKGSWRTSSKILPNTSFAEWSRIRGIDLVMPGMGNRVFTNDTWKEQLYRVEFE